MLEPRRHWLIGIVLGVQIAGAFFVQAASRPRFELGGFFSMQSEESAALSEAESQRAKLVGTWQDNYRAKRTLTLRPDGTATMHCELQGLHRLFAHELWFEHAWTLEGDQLELHVVGGEPKAKIDFVVKLKGERMRQTVLAVTSDRLHVYDETEATEFHWRRTSSSTERPTGFAAH